MKHYDIIGYLEKKRSAILQEAMEFDGRLKSLRAEMEDTTASLQSATVALSKVESAISTLKADL